MSFSNDELSVNAKGGTELMKAGLAKHVSPELLDKVHITFSRVRDLATDKPNILYLHDLPNDPESANLKYPEFRAKFDKIVMVSDWQMQMYNIMLGVPYSECVVMPNAIEPIPLFNIEHKLPSEKLAGIYKKKLNLIYHTTPHRGLEILVPVFDAIVKHYGDKLDLTLDVYSSFKIYGWEERDKPYQALFERCKNHPNINYHGTVSNQEVRDALAKADIFAYPSIWPETSCIAAIEALASNCLVVCPNYAALPETTAKFALMYQWHEDINAHARIFMSELMSAIEMMASEDWNFGFDGMDQYSYFNNRYSWQTRGRQWESLLINIIENHDKRKNFLTFNTKTGTLV